LRGKKEERLQRGRGTSNGEKKEGRSQRTCGEKTKEEMGPSTGTLILQTWGSDRGHMLGPRKEERHLHGKKSSPRKKKDKETLT